MAAEYAGCGLGRVGSRGIIVGIVGGRGGIAARFEGALAVLGDQNLRVLQVFVGIDVIGAVRGVLLALAFLARGVRDILREAWPGAG